MAPVTKKAAPAKKPSAHPTFLSMIQEGVKAFPEESRAGVSRPTLKKYLADKYKIDMSSASNVNNFNNAIKRGSEKGDLTLPKGMGGRVKVPAKKSAASAASKDKENIAPKKTAAKPAAAKTAAAKPAAKAATKAPAAKKAAPAAAKKAAPAPAKKQLAAKPARKTPTPAAKPAAKKAAAPAAKKTASATKKAPAAKAAAAKPAAKKAAAPKKAAAKK